MVIHWEGGGPLVGRMVVRLVVGELASEGLHGEGVDGGLLGHISGFGFRV